MSTNIPVPQIQNNARAPEEKFPVWSPEGEKHMHTRQNINDLVRHLGWYQRDPIYLVEQARKMQAHAENILAAAARAASGAAAPAALGAAAPVDHITPRLTMLRKELSDAGGIPDPTWGAVKLEQAIAAKKAGVPMPKDPEDE